MASGLLRCERTRDSRDDDDEDVRPGTGRRPAPARASRRSPVGAETANSARSTTLSVMAGLVPAIHVERRWPVLRVGRHSTAWMPGTRPGMTESAALKLAPMGLVPAMTERGFGRPKIANLAHMGQRPRLQQGCHDSRSRLGSYGMSLTPNFTPTTDAPPLDLPNKIGNQARGSEILALQTGKPKKW